jgi:hypothetical protein
VETLGDALDEADVESDFELSVSVPDGPSMIMLRSGADAWLMYLRGPGDAGFRSTGEVVRSGDASYKLSNGQVDSYPLSWCIDLEQCYKAISYFCVNTGAKPGWVVWAED